MKTVVYGALILALSITPVAAQTQIKSVQGCMVKLDKAFAQIKKKGIDLSTPKGVEIKKQGAETAGKCRVKEFAAATKSYDILQKMLTNWKPEPASAKGKNTTGCKGQASKLSKKLIDYKIPKDIEKMLAQDISRMEKKCNSGFKTKADKMHKSIDGTITDMKGMGAS
jgi:ribosomal protein S2